MVVYVYTVCVFSCHERTNKYLSARPKACYYFCFMFHALFSGAACWLVGTAMVCTCGASRLGKPSFFFFFFPVHRPTSHTPTFSNPTCDLCPPSQVALRKNLLLHLRLLRHFVWHLQPDHSHTAEHGVLCESLLPALW